MSNSVFEYTTQKNVVFNMAASMAINFNIVSSTFYSKEAGNANFIALSGKRPWQITGYEEETGKLTVANNTFYNVAKNKQFLNTNTLKGQRYLYEVNSNIFVDVSNKKIYGNMTNNNKQLTTDGKNTYMHNGTFFAETNYNGDEGLQTNPEFVDAANGDFTIGERTDQAKYKTGDPRWLVDYVGIIDLGASTAAIDVEVPANLGEDGGATDLAAFLDSYLENSPNPAYIKLTLQPGGEYTISKSIETISAIQILGDEWTKPMLPRKSKVQFVLRMGATWKNNN